MEDMQEINVGEIVRQIRENIRKQEKTDLLAAVQHSSNQYSSNDLVVADLAALQNSQDICRIHFTSHRKFLGPLIILAKKFVRQLLTPSLERQSEYNALNNQLALHLWQQAEALQQVTGELSDRIERVHQDQISTLQALHGARQELAEQVGGVHQEQVSGLQALRLEFMDQLGDVHQRHVTGLQAVRRELSTQLGGVHQEQGAALQALRSTAGRADCQGSSRSHDGTAAAARARFTNGTASSPPSARLAGEPGNKWPGSKALSPDGRKSSPSKA